MRFDVNVNLRCYQDSQASELLKAVTKLGEVMSAALDKLTAEVAETASAVDSVLELVTGLAQQIRDLKDDPAKLDALADELDKKQQAIANAVAENTGLE